MFVYIIGKTLSLNFNLVIWTNSYKISKFKDDVVCNIENK
jgi:hypothetical protein